MSEQAAEAFEGVEQTLAAVEQQLSVFQTQSLDAFLAPLTPLERDKVNVSVAYAVNALLYVFLKTQGVSAKDIRQTHVKQELERVKGFVKKIKDVEELAKGPRLVLDKDASKRFVHNALSSDQVSVDALKAKEGEAAAEKTGKEQPKGKRQASPSGAKGGKKNKRQRK